MKKKKTNCAEILDFIANLLREPFTSPNTDKGRLQAFKDFVSSYPDLIHQASWNTIYTKGRTSTEIANLILDAATTFKPVREFKPTQGTGGKRGLGADFKTCLNVEKIVFAPSTIMADFGVSEEHLLEYWQRINDIENTMFKKQGTIKLVKDPIGQAALWSIDQIQALTLIFFRLFKRDNAKHWKVILILFQNTAKNFSFLTPPLESNKGKQVTFDSILKGIQAVQRYNLGKKKKVPKGLTPGKLSEAKFYYVAWLILMATGIVCRRYNPALVLLKQQIVNKIKPLLDEFPASDQWEIINSLTPQAIKNH